MKLDTRLNLVLTVEGDQGKLFVHSTPLSREVFESYYMVIAKAFSKIHAEGLSVVAGPRVAALVLKQVAMEMGVWDTPGGVQQGLMAEIHRTTNVLRPSELGWQTVSLYQAIGQGLLDPQEVAEIEGAVCFFICVSAMHRKEMLDITLKGMALWGAETTSLNCTAYASSLTTLTEAASTGAMVATSSVPI